MHVQRREHRDGHLSEDGGDERDHGGRQLLLRRRREALHQRHVHAAVVVLLLGHRGVHDVLRRLRHGRTDARRQLRADFQRRGGVRVAVHDRQARDHAVVHPGHVSDGVGAGRLGPVHDRLRRRRAGALGAVPADAERRQEQRRSLLLPAARAHLLAAVQHPRVHQWTVGVFHVDHMHKNLRSDDSYENPAAALLCSLLHCGHISFFFFLFFFLFSCSRFFFFSFFLFFFLFSVKPLDDDACSVQDISERSPLLLTRCVHFLHVLLP